MVVVTWPRRTRGVHAPASVGSVWYARAGVLLITRVGRATVPVIARVFSAPPETVAVKCVRPDAMSLREFVLQGGKRRGNRIGAVATRASLKPLVSVLLAVEGVLAARVLV